MPRYFLNLHERGTVSTDDEGYDCLSVAEARTTAISSARAVMAADILNGAISLDSYIEIVSETGEAVIVGFREAVRIDGRQS